MVRLTDRPAMTIAVDLGRKATKQTNHSLLLFMQHDLERVIMSGTSIIAKILTPLIFGI